MLRWDSLGVLGLVCRLYSERDDTKEDKRGEGEGEREACSVKKEVDAQQPRCRSIKIEREEVIAAEESELAPQHESNEDEEEEFLSEDDNEYYWD